MTEERGNIDFNYTQSQMKQIIKVVGVGGGGGNAVNKMATQGTVPGVSFLLCNTDRQALEHSQVANKIVLGEKSVTKGLGAGNKPERAAAAAAESADEIRQHLSSDDTQMVFITAGMGGGTGTGAAPLISKIAMELGILTIGIVTIPFEFEGKNKILQALRGVQELRKNVDALLVVNNERLIDIYPDFTVKNAFAKADETLSNAARGISEIINIRGEINLDFNDVETTLKAGGVAIISTGYGRGSNRLDKAIQDALNSPLLNNNNVTKAKRVLLSIYSSSANPLTTEELKEVSNFTSTLTPEFENIWGYRERDDLEEDTVAVTLLASGFDYEVTEQSIRGFGRVQEDPIADPERLQSQEEEQKLFETFYGKDIFVKKISKPLLLNLDELDDESILSILEDTPALHRDLHPVELLRADRQRYKAVERTRGGEAAPAAKPTEAESKPPRAGGGSRITINFQ